MKKIFSLLSLVMLMFAVSANAQSRKTWDFSKGVSDESRAALDADASWTKTVADGVTTAWASASNINGEAMANGNVVKELSGLYFSDFAAVNALLYRITNIRLQKNCAITIKGVTAGEKVVIKAQSANTTATDRGFALDNAQDANGNSSFICLGRDAAGAPEGGVTTVEATVIANGDLKISIGVNGAPKSGIEILSIVLGDGDKNIKKWDFSAFSEATVNQVCAAEDWTASESASKNYITGNEIRWINTPTLDANDDLTAGGEAIKELKGLRHDGLAQYSLGLAFNYGQTLDGNNWGPYKGGSYIWVMGTATKIIVPNVKSGSTLKLGVETHKLIPAGTSDARGFKVIAGGVEVDTKTTTDYQELSYAIPASADEYVDVEIVATKGCHLYFIEAEVKDETVVDKNPSLGSIVYSPKSNSKVAADGSTQISMTFPKAQNIHFATPVTIEGYLENVATGDKEEFDGVSGTISEGIVFTLSDFMEIEENTQYKLVISKIIIGDESSAYQDVKQLDQELIFTSKGAGIKEPRSWNFKLAKETAEAIAKSIDNNFGVWASSSKGRYSVATPLANSAIYVAEGVELANTAGLTFNMNTANDILVGTPAHVGVGGADNAGGNDGKLQLGGGTPDLIIPSCNEGDEITVKALWSTRNSGVITITNGVFTTAEGTEVTEFNLTGSAAEYKIVATSDDDVILKSKNVVYTGISIYPFNPDKKEYNYTIVATTPEGAALKTLAEGKALENDKVEGTFSFWLADEDGKLYTRGERGNPFTFTSTVLSEDPIGIEYKAKSYDGMTKVMYVSEAEDIEGATLSTHANAAARSSNCKAAYLKDNDASLCVLPAGTYVIRALIFDPNTSGAPVTFAYGDNADEQVTLYATLVNFTEEVSEPIELTEPREIIWKVGGDDTHALDAVLIYEYDPNAVAGVAEAKAVKADVVKFAKNNALLIKTAKGVFNAAGMQVK